VTVAAFVFSCIALPLSIIGSVLGVLSYRRAGARVKVTFEKVNAVSPWSGTEAPPVKKQLMITATNTGLAKVEVRNPHWRVPGQAAFVPVNTVGETTLEGLHSKSWTYDAALIAHKLGATRTDRVQARAAVILATGKVVYSQPLQLGPEDLHRVP
jgi:hypothetical protein